MRRELGELGRGRASRGVRAAGTVFRYVLHGLRESRARGRAGRGASGTSGASRFEEDFDTARTSFGSITRHMAPTVNDVSSPRFFTPLPFASGAAGPSGAAGAVRDDHHPHGHAVAHGVKRDASQMMTVEERDERVRKIVSLVKVLLTGACGRDIARVSTRDTRPSPIAQAAAFGPRTVALRFRVLFPDREKASARSTSINLFSSQPEPTIDDSSRI